MPAKVPGNPYIAVIGPDARDRAAVVSLLHSIGVDRVESLEHLDIEAGAAPEVMIFPAPAALALLAEARRAPGVGELPIVVATAAGDSGAGMIHAGADSVFRMDDDSGRIHLALEAARSRAEERRVTRTLQSTRIALLRVNELLSAGGALPQVLRDTLLIAQELLLFDRASLVAHAEASDFAYVVAATDDPALNRFTLAVREYPELLHALQTGEILAIPDVSNHPITAPVAEALRDNAIGSILVVPITWKGRRLGALLFRRSATGLDHLRTELIGFSQLLAQQLAAQLSDSGVLDHFRDQTRRISRANYEAERRMRTIASLKEHFEASADGIVVLDETGAIIFVNGTAEAITGFAADALSGVEFSTLVAEHDRGVAGEIVERVLAGTNLEALDLELKTTWEEPLTVSITTSTVLARSGAAVLSFRDVTAQRALEAELGHTKDFLENLIDSAVDAIIASDMRGQVILFNKGAETIFGYRAEDVIGRIPVWKLYPPGVAPQVMRMLRSQAHGGIGRLEQTRREVVTARSEIVPVNMTAAIIYEGGREVASVGIFSDLRERIRIEQRLLQAQEQLEEQKRQAMVAELAGAAAHELNQPLTSITGYTQLLQRRCEPDDPNYRGLSVILSEADRMAEIVRKIGRITRFETVEYVGGASIVDLDRSAASSQDLKQIGGPEEDTEVISLASGEFDEDTTVESSTSDSEDDPQEAAGESDGQRFSD